MQNKKYEAEKMEKPPLGCIIILTVRCPQTCEGVYRCASELSARRCASSLAVDPIDQEFKVSGPAGLCILNAGRLLGPMEPQMQRGRK